MNDPKIIRVRKRIDGDAVLEAVQFADTRDTASINRWVESASLGNSAAYVKIVSPPFDARDVLYLNQYRDLDGEPELEFTTRVQPGEWIVCDPTVDPAYETHYNAYDDYTLGALFEVVSE